ncbi:hypothetical protein KM043_007514 [Ampulex compressa]|nr:hypothetical protein KM043_007514 [Ampulex compressa]
MGRESRSRRRPYPSVARRTEARGGTADPLAPAAFAARGPGHCQRGEGPPPDGRLGPAGNASRAPRFGPSTPKMPARRTARRVLPADQNLKQANLPRGLHALTPVCPDDRT